LNPNGGYPTVTSITSIGSKMYAGTANGVFKSEDNGLTWTYGGTMDLGNISILDVAATGDNIFAATSNGVYLSTDNCLSWTLMNNGLQTTSVSSLLLNGSDIYAGTTAGVYKSTDFGLNWTALNQGLPVLPYANSLYIQGNYLYTDNFTIPQSIYRRALSGTAPLQPSIISGSATPCIGSSQIYSVINVPGVTYAWQFPAGWVITAGGTTNSLTVTVGSTPGIVLVTPSNGWGSGPAQYLIVSPNTNPPAQPSTITGLTNPLEGSSESYSVINDPGVSYAWTFPSGWIQTAGGTTHSITVTVGSGLGNITVTPSTPCGTGTPGTLSVTPIASSKSLSLIVFLEGLYDGAGLMHKAQGIAGDQFPGATADQVTVELHNATTGALEYSLGNMNLSTSGVISGSVPAIHNGNYFIYIIHRNSITVSTASPVSFAGSSITYDFSTGIAQAFGSNMKDVSGVAVAFAGEATQDCGIDSSDMIAVDNDNAAFASGYLVTDINGDGGVDSSDMILVDNNNAAFIGCVLPF